MKRAFQSFTQQNSFTKNASISPIESSGPGKNRLKRMNESKEVIVFLSTRSHRTAESQSGGIHLTLTADINEMQVIFLGAHDEMTNPTEGRYRQNSFRRGACSACISLYDLQQVKSTLSEATQSCLKAPRVHASQRHTAWQIMKKTASAKPFLDELYRASPEIAQLAHLGKEFFRIMGLASKRTLEQMCFRICPTIRNRVFKGD